MSRIDRIKKHLTFKVEVKIMLAPNTPNTVIASPVQLPKGSFNVDLLLRIYKRGIRGSRDSLSYQDIADAGVLLGIHPELLPPGYGPLIKFHHSTRSSYRTLFLPEYDWKYKVTVDGMIFLRKRSMI